MATPSCSSPCTNRCKLEGQTCTGCLRTLDEIKHWFIFSDKEKQKTLQEIERRKKQK
jgi:hypothetical protein